MTRGPGRWIAAIVLTAALCGCAASAGDGNIVDDWSVMPSAPPKIPSPGFCYPAFDVYAVRVGSLYTDPIPCTTSHVVETFHVGEFPATVTLLPRLGEAEYWRAFDECERKAKDFLGGDWFSGRLFLQVTVPLARQWDGGRRWYRCELIETKFMFRDDVVKRESSLAGALGGAAPLAQRCGDVVGLRSDGWDDLTPVDCSAPHDVEYTGVIKLSGTDPPTKEQFDSIAEGCWDVVARFTGGNKDRIRVGMLSWGPAGESWKRGDRWLRCYAWNDRKMLGTVKGIGNSAPRG